MEASTFNEWTVNYILWSHEPANWSTILIIFYIIDLLEYNIFINSNTKCLSPAVLPSDGMNLSLGYVLKYGEVPPVGVCHHGGRHIGVSAPPFPAFDTVDRREQRELLCVSKKKNQCAAFSLATRYLYLPFLSAEVWPCADMSPPSKI